MKNRILMMLFVLLFSITAIGQNNIPFLECHYAEKFLDNRLKQDMFRQDEMVLRISRRHQSFSVYGEDGAMKFRTAYWQKVETKLISWQRERKSYIH